MQVAKIAAAVAMTFSAGAYAAPTISFTAPLEGGTLSGNVQGPPNCIVTGSNLTKVMFYLNGVLTNTDGNLSNGLGCWIDTTKYPNGSYTVKAVGYDAAGATATASRSIKIQNGTTTSGTAPTLAFQAPAEGGTLSGNVQGPPNCIVTGSNLTKVMFYLNGVLTNTDGNLSNGLGCWIDTTKYPNGSYTVKAVGYNAAGATVTVSRGIKIANGTSSSTNAAPTVSLTSPAAGATLSGTAACAATASDDKGVSSVAFALNGTAITTDSTSPYTCSLDTTKFPNGSYNLTAKAVDASGASATATRTVSIQNTVSTPPPSTGSIDAADILGRAMAYAPFSQQSGYTAQVIGTHTSASSIPESGITYSTLSNGETLRLGKETDPVNSVRKAFAFQVAPNDPLTSSSHRSELRFGNNIEFNKTYWTAFSVFVRDWGTLSSGDSALFGTQLHSGDDSSGYSPAFGLYTSNNGRNFQVQVRSKASSTTLRYADRPIPFGRWVDVVMKFKQNTSGAGFLQVWYDGEQVVNHTGNLGFPVSAKDYFKFGYYNWSSFNSNRKVMLRSPIVVADPTGSKYSASTLRAYINAQ
jgi:hypothetical protein